MADSFHLSRAPFFSLDPTSAQHVFSFLGPKDLCAAAMVCREWRSTTSDPSLWRELLESNEHPMLAPYESLSLPAVLRRETQLPEGTFRFQLPIKSRFSEGQFDGCSKPQHFRRDINSQPRAMEIQTGAYGLSTAGKTGNAVGFTASCKETYEVSEAWRKGHTKAFRLAVKGSDKASSVKIAPGGQCLVFASGGRGACHVFDLCTGKRCTDLGLRGVQDRGEAAYEDLLGLYSCSAVSGDCQTVGYGGFDGVVRIHDVASGKARTVLGGLQHRAAVQSLALSWDGSIVAAGLSDGHLALGRSSKQRLSDYSSNKIDTAGSCLATSEAGEEYHLNASSTALYVGDWWMVRQLGPELAVTCVEENLAGDGKGPDRNLFVAGTSGGHVTVIDGETGQKRAALVGSCSCPVACLCIHSSNQVGHHKGLWDDCGRLVYGGFLHQNTGNGHSNAVYVWDLATSERVALLYPGGGGGARQTRDRVGRGSGYLGTGNTSASGPIKSVFADGYKVAVASGKAVTVFEVRTWKMLYELTLSHQTQQESQAEPHEMLGEKEQQRDTDWFWNLAEGEGGGGGSHITASGVESCISPTPLAGHIEETNFDEFFLEPLWGRSLSLTASDTDETSEHSSSPTFTIGENSEPSLQYVALDTENRACEVEALKGECSHSMNLSSREGLLSGVPRIGSLGRDQPISFSAMRAPYEHPRIEAVRGKVLVRSSSDGDLRGGGPNKSSPRVSFGYQTDEPATQRGHFSGNQMVVPLKGGAIGMFAFACSQGGKGTARVDVIPRCSPLDRV